MNDKIILITPEEQEKLLSNGDARSYNIYIHHPGGEWVYNWGEVISDSAPSYDMFRDFLEEDDIESHLESLDHNSQGSTPTPSEFVHALTFPECIQFLPLTGNEYQDWLESKGSQ